jgi:hypothetical protein
LLWVSLDIAKLQGINRTALTANPNLWGTVAANPAELTYFHVQAWDSAAQTGSVNTDVIIEYEAVFLEPRDQTQSLLKLGRVPVGLEEEKTFVHLNPTICGCNKKQDR